MTTRVGFTGTRAGLTQAQANALAAFLKLLPEKCELHHGDCIGADAIAHQLATDLGWRTVAHPALTGIEFRANLIANERRHPCPPLVRNEDIVFDTDQLIACPRAMHEEIRSGTWQTVR